MGRIIQGEIGIPFPCQPLKTGQTIQYSSKEDDGYWEKGKSKLYVPLILAQYSGTVNIVLNAKTHALSNNCVFDKRTGLMWARYVPLGDIGPGNDGLLLWVDAVNDEDIFDFKDQADVKGLGGHSDWRVPNLLELFSLIKLEGTAALIDGDAFPLTPQAPHWTSTTIPTDNTKAFYIHFDVGYSYSSAKTATSLNCRLVRGPK